MQAEVEEVGSVQGFGGKCEPNYAVYMTCGSSGSPRTFQQPVQGSASNPLLTFAIPFSPGVLLDTSSNLSRTWSKSHGTVARPATQAAFLILPELGHAQKCTLIFFLVQAATSSSTAVPTLAGHCTFPYLR